MAEIIVKTPLTTNGRDPIIGDDGKPEFRIDILNAAARPIFEKMNTKLPKHLQKVIIDVKPENTAKTVKDDTGK